MDKKTQGGKKMAENRIKRDRNWIREVTLENIGPFGGAREFEFREGLNIVTGPGGSGKTRLLQHIAAAWTGNLVSDGWMERDFSVRVETNLGAAEISDSGDGWERTRSWTRPEGWDAAVLVLEDMEALLAAEDAKVGNRERSGGEKMAQALRGLIRRTGEDNIILLDEPFGSVDASGCREILGLLAKLGCQVILATKRPMDFPAGANVIRLEHANVGKR